MAIRDAGTDHLLADLDAGVLTLTLNRPEVRNDFSRPLLEALGVQLARAVHDAEVRCIVVTGAGRGICAGCDVKGMAAARAGAQALTIDERIQLQRSNTQASVGALYRCPKPTLAAQPGAAAGGRARAGAAPGARRVGGASPHAGEPGPRRHRQLRRLPRRGSYAPRALRPDQGPPRRAVRLRRQARAGVQGKPRAPPAPALPAGAARTGRVPGRSPRPTARSGSGPPGSGCAPRPSSSPGR